MPGNDSAQTIQFELRDNDLTRLHLWPKSSSVHQKAVPFLKAIILLFLSHKGEQHGSNRILRESILIAVTFLIFCLFIIWSLPFRSFPPRTVRPAPILPLRYILCILYTIWSEIYIIRIFLDKILMKLWLFCVFAVKCKILVQQKNTPYPGVSSFS